MTRDELEALEESGPAGREKAFQQALSAIGDPSPGTRAAAARALAATGDPAPVLDALDRLATDSDVGVRLAVAAALAESPWRGRLDRLAKLLEDRDGGVAFLAADGLAHAGDRRGVPLLLKLASVRRTRFTALEALLALDEPELVPLARRLASAFFKSPFERALAAVVLAAKGDEPSRVLLREVLQKPRAEERPFVVVHLARVDPVEGRRRVEALAKAEGEYLRESALLALAKVEPAWWSAAADAVRRNADEDAHVAAELLLGLFDVDAAKSALLSNAYVDRDSELGSAARRVRLQAARRAAFPEEVLLRCD